MKVIAIAAGLFFLAVSASWGGAADMRGAAALKSGGVGSVLSISCAAPGDCAAGGYYRHGRHREAFVISETNGTWGHPINVPGMAALNPGGSSRVLSISCGAAGECAAGGYYRYYDGPHYPLYHRSQPFVVTA